MNGFREITARISYTSNSVIASCDSERIASVGSDEYEAVQRLRDMVNRRYGNVFPPDTFNS